MSKDIFPYHACGKATHIDMLDAKPNDPGNPGGCDWERFECRECYGPGFEPGSRSPPRFRNSYECERCSTTWQDEWSCACDDRCPTCNASNSPSESVEIDSPSES